MPALAVGMFLRERRGMATKRGRATRDYYRPDWRHSIRRRTALARSVFLAWSR